MAGKEKPGAVWPRQQSAHQSLGEYKMPMPMSEIGIFQKRTMFKLTFCGKCLEDDPKNIKILFEQKVFTTI